MYITSPAKLRDPPLRILSSSYKKYSVASKKPHASGTQKKMITFSFSAIHKQPQWPLPLLPPPLQLRNHSFSLRLLSHIYNNPTHRHLYFKKRPQKNVPHEVSCPCSRMSWSPNASKPWKKNSESLTAFLHRIVSNAPPNYLFKILPYNNDSNPSTLILAYLNAWLHETISVYQSNFLLTVSLHLHAPVHLLFSLLPCSIPIRSIQHELGSCTKYSPLHFLHKNRLYYVWRFILIHFNGILRFQLGWFPILAKICQLIRLYALWRSFYL